MTFPVYVYLFGSRIPAHLAMEVIAYASGFQLYLYLRRRQRQSAVEFEPTMWMIVACIFGALFGSKILAWAESPLDYWPHRYELAAWMGGKTIVGGLLGGWIGVELAKRRLGIRQATGDLYVFPLILGMCLGRIGCFLTGLPDHTYGIATGLPWGVNFGDGIARHPTQLYEVLFLLCLALAFIVLRRREWPDGAVFRLFMASYLLFRFLIEFIKPRYHPYVGLSMIQLASIAGLIVAFWSMLKLDWPEHQLLAVNRA